MIEKPYRFFLGFRQVVHAHRDDPYRPRHQLIGSAAFRAVPLHVAHRAVEFVLEPGREARLGLCKIDIADASLLKAEFPAPVNDLCLKDRHIGIAVCIRGDRLMSVPAAPV